MTTMDIETCAKISDYISMWIIAKLLIDSIDYQAFINTVTYVAIVIELLILNLNDIAIANRVNVKLTFGSAIQTIIPFRSLTKKKSK